jgi:hypothetical protein
MYSSMLPSAARQTLQAALVTANRDNCHCSGVGNAPSLGICYLPRYHNISLVLRTYVLRTYLPKY